MLDIEQKMVTNIIENQNQVLIVEINKVIVEATLIKIKFKNIWINKTKIDSEKI